MASISVCISDTQMFKSVQGVLDGQKTEGNEYIYSLYNDTYTKLMAARALCKLFRLHSTDNQFSHLQGC